MRLLHTSDWHLGRTLHGADLIEHQAAFLEWLGTLAKDQRIDGVLVAGDVYDRAVPNVDAVRLLDETLVRFASDRIPLVMISGNHDSAVRLGFGGGLSELAGVHLRTSVASVARPVMLSDAHGAVAIYGVPFLLPDAVMDELEAERSHAAVLQAAMKRVLGDARERDARRTVVMAHAFVTGGEASDSERDIRVGGVNDVAASVFNGASYVALGHLHGPQQVKSGIETVVRYSGSPLAYSFSERAHAKAVTLVEIDDKGAVTTQQMLAPVPRPLREVRGTLEGLLARADGDLAELRDAWVKVVLTDRARPMSPMEKLRERWPHTLELDFQPEGERGGGALDPARVAAAEDPVEVCAMFVAEVSGDAPSDTQRAVLRDAVESAQRAQVSD